MTDQSHALPPASARVFVALFAPLTVAFILSFVVARLTGIEVTSPAGLTTLMGSLGLSSWFMGWVWYGIRGMGLRGGRPLLSSAGFAVLGWVALLLLRLYFIESAAQTAVGISQDFFYLLLFEAFAVQLWTFGLFFRSVADWRGPLTAAIASGLIFGAFAGFFFLESDYQGGVLNLTGLLYFIAWGLFYGMVRLRTGSIIGMVLVQALQSLTTWHIFFPQVPPTFPETFNNLYLGMGVVYMILLWRLWPNEEEDYRV